MANKEIIGAILRMIAEYNRSQYEYGKEYRKYGTDHLLRHDQVHLINYIGQNPDCNLRYLADTLGLSLPTVSLQVKKLEKMGLVLKRRSDLSQRELELNLTEQGESVFRYHDTLDREFDAEIVSLMLERYSEDDLKLILDFVTHIMMEKYIHI